MRFSLISLLTLWALKHDGVEVCEVVKVGNGAELQEEGMALRPKRKAIQRRVQFLV